MLNAEFRAAQVILENKVSMQILKVTRTFYFRCECERVLMAYCMSSVDCKACDLPYVVASIWKEKVVIGGQTHEVIALAGRCPQCHRKNIVRAGVVPECAGCKHPSRLVHMPLHASELKTVSPQCLLSEIDYQKNRIVLSWGGLDLASLRCKAKYRK